MKNVLFLSLLVLPFLSVAQKKLSYGISFYANLSSALYTAHDTVPQDWVDIYKETETVKTSYSFHAFGEYTLSDKSQLTFGLGFQNTGYATIKQDLRIGFQPTSGKYKVKYIWHNLELPIHYKRYFNSSTYASVGLIGQYRLGTFNSSKIWYDDSEKERNIFNNYFFDYTDLNLATGVGIGKDIKLKEKYTLFVQAYGQYGLLGLRKEAAINRNLVSIGIKTGIRFR